MSPPLENPAMQPHDLPSNKDQRPQCWKDVKIATGFSRYGSFLKALKGTGPQFKDLLDLLSGHPTLFYKWDSGDVNVLDILKDRSTSISLTVKGVKVDFPKSARTFHRLDASTEVLQHLRSPPENVQARIVLWSILEDYRPHRDMIDALGLGLQIYPSFFDALLSVTKSPSRTLNEQECVKIGDKVAAVTRNYRAEGATPPILLVAGTSLPVAGTSSLESDLELSYILGKTPLHEQIEEVLSWETRESMLPCRSAIDKLSQSQKESVSSDGYLSLVQRYVRDDSVIGAEGDALLWIAMLALLHLEVSRLRVRCQIVQSELLQVKTLRELRDSGLEYLGDHHFWLRRHLERFERSMNHFNRYFRSQGADRYLDSQGAGKWLESVLWISQEENIKEAIVEARATEAEARDLLQLHIGDLSILESRKSIKLSNQQMDEAKRGKLCKLTLCKMNR